jgi:hypothetical protein
MRPVIFVWQHDCLADELERIRIIDVSKTPNNPRVCPIGPEFRSNPLTDQNHPFEMLVMVIARETRETAV